MLLSFQKEILHEVCPGYRSENGDEGDDTLLILGKGLGIEIILKAFFSSCLSRENLVFLLNFEEDDLKGLEALSDPLEDTANPHFKRVPSDATITERLSIYEKGGLIAVSSRMLMMDLLLNQIPSFMMTGLILLNVHTIHEYSNEAFCVYLFRQKYLKWLYENVVSGESSDGAPLRTGFIKAFTDHPEKLTYLKMGLLTTDGSESFNILEKRCRMLGVSRVLIYPR